MHNAFYVTRWHIWPIYLMGSTIRQQDYERRLKSMELTHLCRRQAGLADWIGYVLCVAEQQIVIILQVSTHQFVES